MMFTAAESLPATFGALRSLLVTEENRISIAEQLAGEPQRIVDLSTSS
ncbi:MAG: hypothetical protein GY953_08910 [bacterium]|nr:hypothetical protein [bacterium]